jgi:hypothetical protein
MNVDDAALHALRHFPGGRLDFSDRLYGRSVFDSARGRSGIVRPRGLRGNPATMRPGIDADGEPQAKALRLRMYVLCSECAHLIDLAEGNRPQRDVESIDLIRHAAEEHGCWLEMLGLSE